MIHAFGGIELVTFASDAASYASAHFPSFSDAHAVIDAVHVKFPAFLGDQTARSFEMVSPRITDGNGVTPLSFVKRGVELGQEMMGLLTVRAKRRRYPRASLSRRWRTLDCLWNRLSTLRDGKRAPERSWMKMNGPRC